MKLQIFCIFSSTIASFIIAGIAARPTFAADYVYTTTDACANGLTLTFSTTSEENIIDSYTAPIYQCTDMETPTAPGDSGCRASVAVGETLGYKVQLGSLQYSNNLGQSSSGEMDVIVYADLRNGSTQSDSTLVYNLDDQLGSLDTLNSSWGDGLDEYEGTGLNPLPSIGGVQKVGNQFPALAGYIDHVFQNVPSLNVYAANCAQSVLAVR